MDKIKKIEICEYKGLKFEVEQEYYFDDFLKAEYVDVNLGNKNLRKIRNEYRKINNLLTDDEIKQIRNMYNLSQRDFAIALGFGEVTITRYESKTIQEKAQDKVLRDSQNPKYFLSMLIKNKEKFININGTEKFDKLISDINKLTKDVSYKINQQDFLDRGNKHFDFEKLKSIIHQIIVNKKEVTKTFLAKLLWYIDCLNFYKNNESMTGLAYISMQYGAYPKYYEELLSDEFIITEQSWKKDYECLYIKDAYSSFILSEEEIKIIEFIVNKFKYYNVEELVKYMHNEKAYKETTNFDIISYEYSSDIKLFKDYN